MSAPVRSGASSEPHITLVTDIINANHNINTLKQLYMHGTNNVQVLGRLQSLSVYVNYILGIFGSVLSPALQECWLRTESVEAWAPGSDPDIGHLATGRLGLWWPDLTPHQQLPVPGDPLLPDRDRHTEYYYYVRVQMSLQHKIICCHGYPQKRSVHLLKVIEVLNENVS